jgi:hypothetical protein
MEALWKRLQRGAVAQTLTRDEVDLARKLAKAVQHLAANPYHPGLQSHEIAPLTQRFGQKVFESYLENDTPGAGRMFWVYGPDRGEITVVALEPHPDDTNAAYARIPLAGLPPRVAPPSSSNAPSTRKRQPRRSK